MRVDLPGGQWADLKEVDELLDGDRKAARKHLAVNTDDEGNMIYNAGMSDAMYDAVFQQVVTGWSFEGKPIPAMLPGVTDGLSIRQARALRDACQEHFELIWGTGEDANPTGDGSPT